MSYNKSIGFSLIELMVVIAIAGILVSIAVPSYRTYMLKSRVSEVIAAAATAQQAVNAFVQENPSLTTLTSACSTLASGGTHVYTAMSTTNLSTVSISPDCIITATSAPLGGASGPTVVITTTPILNSDGSLTWSCTSGKSQYAPSNCQ